LVPLRRTPDLTSAWFVWRRRDVQNVTAADSFPQGNWRWLNEGPTQRFNVGAGRAPLPLIPVLEQKTIHDLLLVLDLAGTFVFAISGAMLGVRRRLDIFGILVLSFVASGAGGITRDLLIGAVTPAAISDWRYLAVALAAGLLTFFSYSPIARVRTAILVFDAAGLALFAVAGTQKALTSGLNPLMAALLGMLTGIGGGIVRDLLVARTPTVLQSDLYALAALAGAVLVIVGHGLNWPIVPTAIAGAGVCFGLRLMAIRYGWNLPVARTIESGDEKSERE